MRLKNTALLFLFGILCLASCKQDSTINSSTKKGMSEERAKANPLRGKDSNQKLEDRDYTAKDLMASGKRGGNVLQVPPPEKVSNKEEAFRTIYEGFFNGDKVGKSTSMSTFTFNVTGTEIYSANVDELKGLANALKDNSNVKVQIQSHSNQALSITHSRANSVKQLLIQNGAPAEQISSMGKGRENKGKAAGNLISVKLLAN